MFGFKINDKNNNHISLEDSNGFWSKSKYDKNNNHIYFENSTGYWNKSKYDKNNNIISYENSNGYWFKRKFDKNNNRISYEDSDGIKRTLKIMKNKKHLFYILFFSVHTWFKQLICKHKEWNCDKQIRTIVCRNCDKRAWIKEYNNLY